MKTLTITSITKAVRNVSVATLIAGMVVVPSTASAGLADKIQQVRGNVTELKNNVQKKVENVQDKIEDIDGDGLEQIKDDIESMFRFIKQTQASYKEFVGADKCGVRSPCGVFRTELRSMIQSFVALPGELEFVEHVPPAVRQLEKMTKLVDFLPPPILFASETVLGNAFDEIRYRIELVRYAASQTPKLPTMDELSQASARSTARVSSGDTNPTLARTTTTTEPDPSFPYCTKVLDTRKAGRELLTTVLEHLGDFVWDLADTMEDSKAGGTSPGVTSSWKNPSKATVQKAGLIIKGIRQVIEIKVAATAAICEKNGYKAPAN